MVRRLYTLAVPASALLQTRGPQDQQSRQTTERGVLQEDVAPVESTGIGAKTSSLRATLRGKHAREMAAEFDELAMANGFATLPYFEESERTPFDGFYAVSVSEVDPIQAQTDVLQSVNLQLTRQGTRRSHWRSVTTSFSEVQMPKQWGTSTTAEIGIPATAMKPRWVDSTGDYADASAVATRTGAYADVDVYDVQNSPFGDGSTLIYDVPYPDIGPVDCRVWDDHGVAKTDANGVVQWSKAFRTDHDFVGQPIAENGLVRLTFDESTSTLTVEQWDSSTSSWASVSQGASNWELFDVDVREIAPARVAAIVEFRDPSTSPTSYYALEMLLHRGWTLPQWSRPQNETDAVPSGLVDKLDPVAATSKVDPGETAALTKRTTVHQS